MLTCSGEPRGLGMMQRGWSQEEDSGKLAPAKSILSSAGVSIRVLKTKCCVCHLVVSDNVSSPQPAT